MFRLKRSAPTVVVERRRPTTTPRDANFPARYFVAAEYVGRYSDAARDDMTPWEHFAHEGHAQGRVPSDALLPLQGALRLRAQTSGHPLADITALLPAGRRRALAKGWFWERLRLTVHPEVYAQQANLDEPLDVDATIDHFLGVGLFEGRRVSMFFHADWYQDRWTAATGDGLGQTHPFLHWLTEGWARQIVPTPVFDAGYYLERHKDLERWRGWVFEHYLGHGAFESQRKSSPFIPRPPMPDKTAKLQRRPLLQGAFLTEAGGMDGATSGMERKACTLAAKVARLDSPVMTRLVQAAYEIEPLVRRPYGPRDVNWPPLENTAVRLMDHAERARADLLSDHYDTVVLVPHCRMAGSARVTGALTRALRSLAPQETLLVLTTDLPDFERPDWFPAGLHIADVSAHTAGLFEEQKTRLLLDVVRGLGPRRVINVNSRLGWELFRFFGRQLSDVCELSAYLFTWDLDAKGNKGGYPITYFQECFDVLHRVFVDSEVLHDELVWRYAMPLGLRKKLRVLHTPADFPEWVDHSGVFARRRREGEQLRAFWSGRFDRQKRFDVVVDIARAMPELEIWAWGKQVLGGSGVDFERLPANLRLMGTYDHFEDLPSDSVDFFLYTSEWDGLPTILIDAGARGVATVASAVGGVVDIVSEVTSFPVVDALEPEAYVRRIREMVSEPEDVTRRAQAFRGHVRATCSQDGYQRAVAEALALDVVANASDHSSLGSGAACD